MEVTLACKQCCVTNGYLQRVVWGVNSFLKREKKCFVFFNKIGLPYCLAVFFIVLIAHVSGSFEAFSAS